MRDIFVCDEYPYRCIGIRYVRFRDPLGKMIGGEAKDEIENCAEDCCFGQPFAGEEVDIDVYDTIALTGYVHRYGTCIR